MSLVLWWFVRKELKDHTVTFRCDDLLSFDVLRSGYLFTTCTVETSALTMLHLLSFLKMVIYQGCQLSLWTHN